MSLMRLQKFTLSHGGLPLLENASLQIEAGEHTCLIGRNGAGKSTLLKFIHGEFESETGTMQTIPNLKISYLSQEVPGALEGTIYEIVAGGLTHNSADHWQTHHQIEKTISQFELDANVLFATLSSGMKRRVWLARALVSDPELLLLDEPTNHLDIEAIRWLEKFLLTYQKAFIMITHDRALMQKVASRILEIDNGQLYSWEGHYHAYLTFKETQLNAEEKANALFDKKLAQEEVWIRQGIKARRTRNEGRVRALKKMREQRKERRTRVGQVQLGEQNISLSGKQVIEAQHVFQSYGDKTILKDFSTLIMRGDKIGLIGPNGAGKSTLLNILLKNIFPESGEIEHGTKLEIAYFDQNRRLLNEDANVIDNICEGSDFISIGDQKKHIMSYCQDFLFTPERARLKVKYLSGGERNRVLLAKILSKPCNLLVMDEPTNDLDIETLELLEEKLMNFSGTLLLVSHDREFINNVVTSTLVMEGNGQVGEYVGGYDDWLRQTAEKPAPSESKPNPQPSTPIKPKASTKLNYNEKRELDQLPNKIAELETKIEALQNQLSDPAAYKDNTDTVVELHKKLGALNQELEASLSRWEALEAKNG